MRRSVPLLSVALAAAPLAISHQDSSVTEFRFGAGSGSYASVTRGCDNSVVSKARVDFDNVGGEVSHKFTSPIRLGVRAGQINPDSHNAVIFSSAEDMSYVNPHVSFDWPGFSLGAGLVSANRNFPEEDFHLTPSTHLRVGKKSYFEVAYMEAVPLATSGYLTTGIGYRTPRADFWAGTAAVPQDHFGFLGKIDYRIGDRVGVGGTLRLGNSQGISENAFAVSLSYRFTHRTERVFLQDPDAWRPAPPPAAPVDSAIAPAASDSARSPRRGRNRALRGRRSRRAPC
jgi:hypothetical protein